MRAVGPSTEPIRAFTRSSGSRRHDGASDKERRAEVEYFLVTWGYLALFALTALSLLGIPVGSELAISYAGVLASGQIITGQHHHLQLIAVIAVATAGEITGSLVGYGLGRFGGRALIDRIGKYALLTHKDLDRAEAWFARSGDTVVFFARFIPLIRSFISIAAGIGEMTLRWFLAFSFAACLLWCSALAIIGYALGSTWHRIVTTFSYIGYVAAALAICAVALLIAHRLRALRAEHALHPAQNS